MLTLSNGGIRFCNVSDLPVILTQNDGWIPVLYFKSGAYDRTPAVPSSYVSVTSDNLPIIDMSNSKNKFLREHANDESIHGANIEIFELPTVLRKTVFLEDKKNVLMDLYTLNKNKTSVLQTQGWGIGIVGTNEYTDIYDLSIAGTGAYAKGTNVDVLLKNGVITSAMGEINIGKISKSTSMTIIGGAEKPALMA
jgi:hypothetical protein